jgi:hypothetical protein
VPETAAQAVAEELAAYENRLGAIENHLGSLRTELNSFRAEVTARLSVLTWAVGINAVLTVAILGVLPRH